MSSSAPLDRRAENIVIEAVIVSELKFSNVQRQILCADFVEGTDNTAFEDRPETLNRLSVNSADDVLSLRMIDGCVGEFYAKLVIPNPLIGAEQANLIRHSLVNERLQRDGADIRNYAGDNVALAAHRARDDLFPNATSPETFPTLILVLVLGETTNQGFVNFNDAAQLGFGFDQGGADFMAHGMRSFVRPETHVTLDLERADALFAGEHQMHHLEPLAKRLVRVFKDGASDVREAITRSLDRLTLIALPFKRHGLDGENVDIAATRASNPIGPAALHQIFAASLLIGEHGFKLAFGKLVNWFRSFTGHLAPPVYEDQYGM